MTRDMLLAATLLATAACVAAQPLRLSDDRPFVAVYYFTHWWEPWKSDDDVIRRDFALLADMGVSALCLDHEWSQAIDGNWRLLDRGHRLAREAGLQILPWLSLKVWSDMSSERRRALVKEWYGVDLTVGMNQDGSPAAVLAWDEATIQAGAAYAAEYLDRYRDQALLHLRWEGGARPVVALSVELAWNGGFDDASTQRFRAWLADRYGEDVERLNAAWGTQFASLEAVQPRDTDVFDYARLQQGAAHHPQAVEDHIEFRAQTISESLGEMARRLRERHPDVLILAEFPYQFRSEHPHAEGYRIAYGANPSAGRSADILFFRCTAPLTQAEAEFLRAWQDDTGQPAVLAYRTYSDWANERASEEAARLAEIYGGQAERIGHGLGFYSWNEMVDTHVAPSRPEDTGHRGPLTPEQSQRAVNLLAAMVHRYLHPPAHAGRQ